MFEPKFIDQQLRKLLPKDNSSLSQAMRYSIFAGGKRFRPILCLEAARICGGSISSALPAACALEMIHTFTLIHDDLPAMDDSDLRRGKPTCHKVFGEDIAILAGDALNTLAFEVIAKHCKTDKVANVSAELSDALLKVVKGQVLDLESEGKRITLKQLEKIHLLKTAALIEAAVRMGAILSNAREAQIEALTKYARHLGLAFQITDDILDVTSERKALGKPTKADRKAKKATYPSVLGLAKSRELVKEHHNMAVKSLNVFQKKADKLREIANFVLTRRT
jgi:geranylgeranyl diphosphate synthase type II